MAQKYEEILECLNLSCLFSKVLIEIRGSCVIVQWFFVFVALTQCVENLVIKTSVQTVSIHH
jgi:hypothetical protein